MISSYNDDVQVAEVHGCDHRCRGEPSEVVSDHINVHRPVLPAQLAAARCRP